MADQRLLFSKTERARYISHLDLMRTFQRSFLRADLQVKHTEGFNPHAYVSLPLPLSVGFSSQCEILEFGVPQGTNYEDIPGRLTRALPDGIQVHTCYDVSRPIKQLVYVNYALSLCYDKGTPPDAESLIRDLLGQETFIIDKKSKKAKSGMVQLDLIPLIHSVKYQNTPNTLGLDLILMAQNPGLNPSLLIGAISSLHPILAPDYVSYHRKDILDKELQPFR